MRFSFNQISRSGGIGPRNLIYLLARETGEVWNIYQELKFKKLPDATDFSWVRHLHVSSTYGITQNVQHKLFG